MIPPAPGDSAHAARRTAARGALSVALSRLGALIELAATPAYVWMFGLPSYGLYQVLWSLVNVAENIFDLGTTSALQRILPKIADPMARAGAVRAALLIGILPNLAVALLASLAAPWIAPLFNAAPADAARLVIAIRLFAWALPLWAIVEVATSAVRACHAFGPEVRLRLMWEQVARLAAAVLMWSAGFGLLGLLAAHLISLAITAGAALRLLNRYVPLRDIAAARAGRAMLRDTFLSGVSVLPSNILARVFADVATVIANLLAPAAAGASAAGLYAIARKIASIPQMVRMAFGYVLGPIASAAARGDRATIQALYDFAVRMSLLLALPTCAALIAAGPALLGLFPRGSEAALPILVILTAARGIEATIGPAATIQQVIGRRVLPVLNSAVALVVAGIVLAATQPILPAMAIALAVAAGQVIVAGLSIGQLHRNEGLRAFAPPFARTFAVAATACALIVAIGLATGGLPGSVQGIAVGAAWLALLWLGARIGLTAGDKAALGKAGRKMRL